MLQSSSFNRECLETLSIFLGLPIEFIDFAECIEKFDPVAATEQNLQLEALIEQAHVNMSSTVGITVRRGQPVTDAKLGTLHPTFETIIQYSISKPVYAASRRFEAYRRLFQDLYRGISMYVFLYGLMCCVY